MRIVDADILSYALLENHVATPYTRPLIERCLRGELRGFITATTLLEAYNTLYWHYSVRPRRAVATKILVVAEAISLVPPAGEGFRMAVEEDVPLGDAILVATALDNSIPIVVSNDGHVEKLAEKHGLVYENPIPDDVRKRMK
ncbi:MAG: type II toxin-antitoxin system VapC family toxin [Candidatus Bathyarchaeia archaeon]